MSEINSIILENDLYKLVLSDSCVAESLVLKQGGIECISLQNTLPFFTLTEERPYNNEIKLAHPNKRTTFSANRVRMQDGKLIVGFELVKIEAVVDVTVKPEYITFTLSAIIIPEDAFGLGVIPIVPPVSEFRLIQLPLIPRKRFGEWLNVMWDDEVSVNVLSTSPYLRVSSEARRDYRILYGEALSEVKLKGEGMALVVCPPSELLNVIEKIEVDYNLPRGVESRRSPLINRSYYKTTTPITPETVDEHISYAKKGGFKFMTVYYRNIFKETDEFLTIGTYSDLRPEFKRGIDDLKDMIDKIKSQGIIPGLHILHTHIGLRSPYLTPKADHRINVVRQFTLAKHVGKDDDVIYVEENPDGCPTYERTRVLRFMGELIHYDSFTTEYPYSFKGCKRGYNDTVVREHEIGTVGGILDISEFCANSAYVDPRTSLQDEVADAIAKIYDLGFEYVYFDGSEGTRAPFDINVGLAQYRVYRKLEKAPIFCEGAAKSHFSWHILSGSNAFDPWTPELCKEKAVEHPFKEAERMTNDFTRVNFGWWPYVTKGQRPDIIEYCTALAASWDCPGSIYSNFEALRDTPRTNDILETIRRWEVAREIGFVTEEVKRELRKTEIEHTLLIDENGKFELSEWEQIKSFLGRDNVATAFILNRQGKNCAVLWHNEGEGRILLKTSSSKIISYTDTLGKEEITVENGKNEIIIPLDKKRYLITDLTREELIEALNSAVLV